MLKRLVVGTLQRAAESQGLWQAPKFLAIWPNKGRPQAGGLLQEVPLGWA